MPSGADTDKGQLAVFGTHHTCGEVDIGESIQFVDYDIDIVASYAGRDAGDALALTGAGDGMELTALHLAFSSVEVGGNGLHPSGIADEDHFVGKHLRAEMQVEATSVCIDDELRFRNSCIHSIGI